jgi:hypothetical protein
MTYSEVELEMTIKAVSSNLIVGDLFSNAMN